MIGSTISHYKILEKLGEGGMGIVYKAQDLKLDRLVALKFLPPHFAGEEERKRFIHEAKAASSLDHPNICTFYEIGEAESGHIFIAMAYYEGRTLKEKIGDRPLPFEEAIEIVISVAQGLAYAHEKGVTHRDIKPDNLMLTAKDIPKIMDFGLARVGGLSTITKTGATIGTVPYMSPEQARGEKVDHRSDIWSLGVVLYEMIAGRLPFRSTYQEAVVYSIMNEEPPPLTSLRSDVPMELERIVKKATRKSVADRYQHVEEMVSDLRILKKELESGVSKQPPKEVRPRRKYFALYVGLAAIVFILVVGGLLLFRGGIPSTTSDSMANLTTETLEKKSIAVLPLANLSDSKEDEFFSDGITEDIITQLSKIGDLKVISRTSTMQYKGTNKNIREIGKELGVASILEGSVRRAGDQIRIVAQLVDANSDEHLWAETYDREFKQIFAIQSEIAQKIAIQLKATLTPGVKEQIEKKPTENLEAYTYLLKAREYYSARNNEQAITLLKKAIELDPNYADPYAHLGQSYAQRAVRFGYPVVWLDSALVMAQKAIMLDQNLGEGFATLARVHTSRGHIRNGLETARKAVGMNEMIARSQIQLGMTSFFLGRLYDAARSYEKASELEPRVMTIALLGQMYFALGMNEKSEKVFQRALELEATSPDALYGLGLLRLIEGRLGQSISLSRKAHEASPDYVNLIHLTAMAQLFGGDYPGAEKLYRQLAAKGSYVPASFSLGIVTADYDAALGLIALKTGKKAEAKQFFERSLKMNRKAVESGNELYHYRYNIAAIQAAQGNKDDALQWLQQAVDAGWRLYRIAEIDPFFESLRTEDRFQQILSRVRSFVDEERRKVEETENHE